MTCNIILISGVQHSDLYAVQNGHHDKVPSVTLHSHHSIIVYSPSAVPYVTMTCLFYNWEFVPLKILHPHTPQTISSPAIISFFSSVSMNLFLFCFICSCVLFFRFIQVKSYFLSLCLIYSTYKHSALKVHPCSCKWQDFTFYGWVIFQCMCVCIYIPYLLYSFICL